MQQKSGNKWIVLAFQACVIANGIFGSDEKLFVLSKWVMFAFFAIMAISMLLRKGENKVGKLLFLPVFLIGYFLMSFFWAYDPSVAFRQTVTEMQLFVLLVFTYFAVRDSVEIQDYLNAIYIAGYGMILFALYKYGGLSAYINAMETGRMGGEIANENTYGMLFSSAAICAAYYLVIRGKKLHMFSLILFTFFSLSSGSKKAALMIVAGVLCIAFLRYGFKRLYKTVLIGAIVLILAWYILQLPLFDVIYRRLLAFFTGEGRTSSDDSRRKMIRMGWDLFKERPLFGYGLNNYRVFHSARMYSHNNYIELLVSSGIVGFVLYYAMYLFPIGILFFGRYKKAIWANHINLMLLVWVAIDLVFGYGMVQMYGKNAWILMGVLLATADKVSASGAELVAGEETKLPGISPNGN